MLNIIYGYLIMFKIALILLIVTVAAIYHCCNHGGVQISNSVLSRLLKIPYNPEVLKGFTDCPICQECFSKNDELITLPCDPRHYFHNRCIKEWLVQNAVCPICRTRIDQEALDNSVAKTYEEAIVFMKQHSSE